MHTDSEKFVQNIKSLIDSYKKNGGSLQDASFRICASTQEKLKSFNAINKISDLIKQKLPKDTNVPEIKEQIVYNRQQNANYKHFAVFCDKEKNKQTNHQHGKYTSEKVKAEKLFDGFSIDECKKRSVPHIIRFCEYQVSNDKKDMIAFGDAKDSFIVVILDQSNPDIKGIFSCWRCGNKNLEQDVKKFFDLYKEKGGSWSNAKIRIFGGESSTEASEAKNPIVKAMLGKDKAEQYKRDDFRKIFQYITEKDSPLFAVNITAGKIEKASGLNESVIHDARIFNGMSYSDWDKEIETLEPDQCMKRDTRSAKEVEKFNKFCAAQRMSQFSYDMHNADDSHSLPASTLEELIAAANSSVDLQARIDASGI